MIDIRSQPVPRNRPDRLHRPGLILRRINSVQVRGVWSQRCMVQGTSEPEAQRILSRIATPVPADRLDGTAGVKIIGRGPQELCSKARSKVLTPTRLFAEMVEDPDRIEHCLVALDCHGDAFAAANAERGHALFHIAVFHRSQQRDEHAGA